MDVPNGKTVQQVTPGPNPPDTINNNFPAKTSKNMPIIIGLTFFILVVTGVIFHLSSKSNQKPQAKQPGINRQSAPTSVDRQTVISPITTPTGTDSLLVTSINNFYDEILQALTTELIDWDSSFIITDFDITNADTYNQAAESETQPNKYAYARITVYSKKLQVIRYY